MLKLREVSCVPYYNVDAVRDKLDELQSSCLDMKLYGADEACGRNVPSECQDGMWELLLDTLSAAGVLMKILGKAARKEHPATIN